MKQKRINLKALAALVMMMLLVFSSVSAAEIYDGALREETAIEELVELRTEKSKVYMLSDGKREYVAYAEPIHYYNSATGRYEEIDNSVKQCAENETFSYKSTANSWNVFFGEHLGANGAVMLQKGEYKLSFYVPGAEYNPIMRSSQLNSQADNNIANDTRSVVYLNAAYGVDVAYTVHSGELKEDIVLKTRESDRKITFEINTENLIPVHDTEGLYFKNAQNEVIFRFAPMYAEDANGRMTDAVEYEAEINGTSVTLTVTVDEEFLEDENTAYPVIVDPTTMVTGTAKTMDTCVDEQYSNSNYYSHASLWTGGKLGNNAMRTFIKFDLPENIASWSVVEAKISIKKRDYTAPTVRAHRIFRNWDPTKITWRSQPNFSYTTVSSEAVHYAGDWYRIDVKDIVTSWLSGRYENHGFALKEETEGNANKKTKYYSSEADSPNKPELRITYYYGSRPYQSVTTTNVNCMGYALEYNAFIGLGADDGQNHEGEVMYGDDLLGKNLSQLLELTAETSEAWMRNHIGQANFARIDSYDTEIEDNWYRVALRVGFTDMNSNGIFDEYDVYACLVNDLSDFDFHWWYETSTGDWADKPGTTPSRLHNGTAGTDPAVDNWTGAVVYNSSAIYYKIKDIRDNNW